MHLLNTLFAASLLTACYQAETFQADWAEQTCEWYSRCDLLEVMDYEDVEDCTAEQLSERVDDQQNGEVCESFDRGAAKDCIASIEAKGCEDGFDQPSTCSTACF
jgi:hypothetical protein